MAKSPAWTRKEGKSEKGGLNAKGRASYNKANPGKPGLKAPQPEGGKRRDSFCARMEGMKEKLTERRPRRTRTPASTRACGRGSADMEMMVWNLVLTAVVAMLGFVLKERFAEINRLGILLNRTREEVARDHITRTEFRADMQQLLDRFDRLERKIDNLRGSNAIQQ